MLKMKFPVGMQVHEILLAIANVYEVQIFLTDDDEKREIKALPRFALPVGLQEDAQVVQGDHRLLLLTHRPFGGGGRDQEHYFCLYNFGNGVSVAVARVSVSEVSQFLASALPYLGLSSQMSLTADPKMYNGSGI